jgi:S1-C subfamily serine protease
MTRIFSRLLSILILWCYSASPNLAQNIANPSPQTPPQISLGTGFVVADGYLLTAMHVVRDKDSIWVGPIDGKRWVKAELLKYDNQLDLALLKANVSATPLSFTQWSEVPIGLEVTLIGFPQPRLQGLSKKITQGLINGNRSDRNESFDLGFFQFSAETQVGNSGGPVLAPDGLVVGMVQKKLNALDVAERTKDLPVNVSYGLKSSEILNFLKDTPVTPSIKSLSLNTYLRPYQIFNLKQASIFGVAGRKSTSPPDAPADK